MSYLLDLARSNAVLAVLFISTLAMFAIAIVFLVAASNLRRANNKKAAHWARLEGNWSVAIEYIARGLAGDDTLHYNVPPEQRLILLDYLYKCSLNETRRDRRQLCTQLAQPYVGLLESRVRDGDVWQRARAVRTIAELGNGEHSVAIIKALDDPSPHVAMTAARTYARLRLGPINPLLDRIERYQNWDRRLLRLTLTSLGPSAAPALHARFADTRQSTRTRTVCADSLASLKYEGANDTAITVLNSETDVDLRAAALRVIRAPASDKVRALVRSLSTDEDPVVRAQAIACLARISDPEDMKSLESALADLSPWVVLNAKKGLTALGRTAAEREAKMQAGSAGEWD